MPVREPIITEIAHNTYLINEFGLNAMYLLVGTESALLIDTGSGYCNLKTIIEGITDKPYSVVLTHGHIDHAGGCDIFDSVYIHPADVEQAEKISYEDRVGYGKALKGAVGDADVWEYSEANVRKWISLPKWLPLEDGMLFALGGRNVKVYHTPGHTRGSCSLIDDKSRILFSGDAANVNLLMNLGGAAVTTALNGLNRIKTHENEFDRNYNGHVGYSSFLNCLPMPESVLDDCIYALRGIIDGSLERIEYTNFLFPEKKTAAVEYGKVRVSFSPDYIREIGE